MDVIFWWRRVPPRVTKTPRSVMIQQGLVLLVAGMGIAILFLFVLSVVTTWMSKLVPYINVLPDPEPKKAAPKAAAGNEDAAIAAAIAIASSRQ